MKNIKMFGKSDVSRERLKIIHIVFTDQALYVMYNTQTIQGKDCVNIEIERISTDSKQTILQKEIFEDSWGAMGGDSFHSMVIDAKRHLNDYIRGCQENILQDVKTV